MARLSWIQRLYWRYMSKPAGHRALYLYAIENPIGSILEVGMGEGERIKTVLSLITLPEEIKQLRYAAVDPFESASANRPHLSLKVAHRILAEKGVKAHLIPGDAQSAMPRVAHSILPSDLVIIDGGWGASTEEGEAIARWLPRLCHGKSAIFASETMGGELVRREVPAVAAAPVMITKAA